MCLNGLFIDESQEPDIILWPVRGLWLEVGFDQDVEQGEQEESQAGVYPDGDKESDDSLWPVDDEYHDLEEE